MKLLKQNKVYLICYLFLACLYSYSYSQNIFDLNNSLHYAEYLYKSNEFNLAIQEYERIVFMDSSNNLAKLNLIKSYRKLHADSIALNRLSGYYPAISSIPAPFDHEYLILTIRQKKYVSAISFLNANQTINHNDKLFYKSIIELYNYNWHHSKKILSSEQKLNNNHLVELNKITNEALSIKYKKPAISVLLSSVIPGAGKAYSGYWKDGIFSFLFTTVSAWQSYRGFNKNGIKSVYGWLYGSLSIGFYTGNLFGAAKASHKYNHDQNHIITDKVEILFSSYIN